MRQSPPTPLCHYLLPFRLKVPTVPRVFISFRKTDDLWMRDRIYGALISRFGADQFFKSGVSVAPGSDFPPFC
jgi:hypothetical protein